MLSVSIRAQAIQKPPYEDRAVAPKVSFSISMWLIHWSGAGGRFDLTSNSHLPHAGQQLDETTVGVSQTDHNGGGRDAAGSGIDQTQDKGGESEGAETQGSRIGELSEAGLVGRTLEGTARGGEHGGLLSIDGGTVGGTAAVLIGNVGG